MTHPNNSEVVPPRCFVCREEPAKRRRGDLFLCGAHDDVIAAALGPPAQAVEVDGCTSCPFCYTLKHGFGCDILKRHVDDYERGRDAECPLDKGPVTLRLKEGV